MNKSRLFLSLLFMLPVLTWFAPASMSGGVVTQAPQRPTTYRHPQLAERLLLAPRVWKYGTHSLEVSDLRWSPDGNWAAYCLTEQRENVSDWERISLCCIRADGKQAHRLYTRTDINPQIAAWSPDSRRILFWRLEAHASSVNADGSRLYDVSVLGGKTRLLTYPFQRRDGIRDAEMMREPDTLTFSPNGKYLLLVRGCGRFSTENKRLARLTYPAGTQKWLTNENMAVDSPAWSQDSKQIAFLACPDRKEQLDSDEIQRRLAHTHLWIIDSDGSHQHPLTTDPRYQELSPRWLPDRYTIHFTRQENTPDSEGKSSEWEIHADGTGLRRIGGLSGA